jgi:hypothetical protein
VSSVVRYLVPKLFSASWTLGDPAIEACLNRCRAKSRKDPAKRPQTPVDYDFVNFGARPLTKLAESASGISGPGTPRSRVGTTSAPLMALGHSCRFACLSLHL